ncbi:MAG: Lsm family RNA-binding protein [Candidatus Thorarchaeota archaeon]|nr:Lsm family RNA-binding protein [Candidatus Thorarchaeota archaeon]
MSEVAAMRAFNRELAAVVGATVNVTTNVGKTYTGTLKGIDQNTLSIILSDVHCVEDEVSIPKIFIYGSSIVSFSLSEREISLEGLAKELEKQFPPGGVRYFADTQVVVVMNKVRITKDGVEGSGPLYERVSEVVKKWMEEHGLA